MADMQLDEFARVTLNGSGNGTVSLGPRNSRQVWNVTNLAVFTTSTVNVPTATAYHGTPSPGSSLGGTYDGNNDSTGIAAMLYPGQQLSVQWTGGDAGAVATVSLYGTLEILGS